MLEVEVVLKKKGTLFGTLENSALTSCPGTAGNIGSVRPSVISLLLFFKSRITNPAPYFFQAEDGIRDRNVTRVQTCALPIYILDLRSGNELPLDPRSRMSTPTFTGK